MIPALNRRGVGMTRFVQGADRGQSTLLPECLDDWVADDNPVRVIDAFVAVLDLAELGFGGVERSDEAQSQALRKGAAASACFCARAQ